VVTHKERLIDYINRFIADLANSGAEIAVLLGGLEAAGHERLLEHERLLGLAAASHRRRLMEAVTRADHAQSVWSSPSRWASPGGLGGKAPWRLTHQDAGWNISMWHWAPGALASFRSPVSRVALMASASAT
jgi:Protein of unknown function (DUF2397)